MTVKEAYDTILDNGYKVYIDGHHYMNGRKIPAELLGREVKRIVPASSKHDVWYRVYLNIVYVVERETFDTVAYTETIEEAKEFVEKFEAFDRIAGVYEENSYMLTNEEGRII